MRKKGVASIEDVFPAESCLIFIYARNEPVILIEAVLIVMYHIKIRAYIASYPPFANVVAIGENSCTLFLHDSKQYNQVLSFSLERATLVSVSKDARRIRRLP